MGEGQKQGWKGPRSMGTRRLIAVGLTVPLLGAAVLWWIAGSDMTMARWISLVVIALALGGWYVSRPGAPDEHGSDD